SGAWGRSARIFKDGVEIGSITYGAALESAVDAGARAAWLRNSGGAWIGGGDPASGMSPTFTVSGSGPLYFAATVWVFTSGNATRGVWLHSDAANVTGTPPAGFAKGLPADGAALLSGVDGRWTARLEAHWPIEAALVLRPCSSREAGRERVEAGRPGMPTDSGGRSGTLWWPGTAGPRWWRRGRRRGIPDRQARPGVD